MIMQIIKIQLPDYSKKYKGTKAHLKEKKLRREANFFTHFKPDT